jgi:protein-disulfide isomerase
MPQGVLPEWYRLERRKTALITVFHKIMDLSEASAIVQVGFHTGTDHMQQTMARRSWIALSFMAVSVALIGVGWQLRASTPETVSSDSFVATVGNRAITLREAEKTLALPLYLLETQRHQLLQRAIQTLIDEELLNAEASRKGVPLSQLLDEASQSEAIARLANLPAPVKHVRSSGQTALDTQEQARIRQALIVSLRRQGDVRITLPTPSPPVVPVDNNGDRRLGPDQAPITIVEFSDFQCPYCQRSVQVLKELRQIYGDRIRVVYRDFPGPNHPNALQAAEAARCAGEQGKFWEYHDLLFDRQSSGMEWDFLSLAKELALQPNAFDSCLHAGRFREEITKDLHEGLKLGITSTPTFFINGRPLVGAQPLANFRALIDAQLGRQPLS